MPFCNTCQKDARRVKTLFMKGSVPLAEPKDECENCAPGGKHEEPAWMRHRPTPRYETHPLEYKKRTLPDGSTFYEPTDESKADLEAQVCKQSQEDIDAINSRRNRPGGEIDMNKAVKVAEGFLQEFKKATEEYEKANAEYWNTAAEDYKVQ